MKEHMRNHTGDLPYQCPVCPMRLRNQGTFRAHAIWHAQNPGMMPRSLGKSVAMVHNADGEGACREGRGSGSQAARGRLFVFACTCPR